LDLLQKYWDQIIGGILILVGIVWISKKSIPVGIEGRKPSFHIKGNSTIFIGTIVVILGLIFVLDVLNINWFGSY
jgi:hypothetical protein